MPVRDPDAVVSSRTAMVYLVFMGRLSGSATMVPRTVTYSPRAYVSTVYDVATCVVRATAAHAVSIPSTAALSRRAVALSTGSSAARSISIRKHIASTIAANA